MFLYIKVHSLYYNFAGLATKKSAAYFAYKDMRFEMLGGCQNLRRKLSGKTFTDSEIRRF